VVKRALCRMRRDERGAAMVELAIVLPILMLIVMGIVEFGRAWNVYQVITDAAREGARRAVVRDGDTDSKVGTTATPGTVPAVVLDRLGRAGLPTAGAWSEDNFTESCVDWEPPVDVVDAPTIHGCGWGRQTGEEARVVVRTPTPFFFLRPVTSLVGAEMLSTNFVMRNE
jgi:Flp pilus assembly pilin Flp